MYIINVSVEHTSLIALFYQRLNSSSLPCIRSLSFSATHTAQCLSAGTFSGIIPSFHYDSVAGSFPGISPYFFYDSIITTVITFTEIR